MSDQNEPLDYYEILGVSHDAPADEIQRAYRRLVMEWHPDRSKCPNAPQMIRRINELGEILKSPERRAEYDRDYFLLRSVIAEAARRAHVEERHERERRQYQEQREAAERLRRAEAVRRAQEQERVERERREQERQHQQVRREEADRKRQEEREARERRVREVHERRERERFGRRAKNQYQPGRERRRNGTNSHRGSTTKHSSWSNEDWQNPQIFDKGLLAWSLGGLAMIIVMIPFILLWLNR